jgi:hypothetical protein
MRGRRLDGVSPHLDMLRLWAELERISLYLLGSLGLNAEAVVGRIGPSELGNRLIWQIAFTRQGALLARMPHLMLKDGLIAL